VCGNQKIIKSSTDLRLVPLVVVVELLDNGKIRELDNGNILCFHHSENWIMGKSEETRTVIAIVFFLRVKPVILFPQNHENQHQSN
jgi:hypothetical protein